jgi:hypothetical protein
VEYKHKVLAELLGSAGWDVETRYDSELEWWADEIWIIRSRWRPTDFHLYLTFLVDPMHDGNRSKGQAVWALEATLSMPVYGEPEQNSVTLQLSPKFERGLEQFIKEIGELRDAAA